MFFRKIYNSYNETTNSTRRVMQDTAKFYSELDSFSTYTILDELDLVELEIEKQEVLETYRNRDN